MTPLESAIIEKGHYEPNEDTLEFVDQLGITEADQYGV